MFRRSNCLWSYLKVLNVRPHNKVYITDDKTFGVMRPFPGPFKWNDSDPFLLCDIFGPEPVDRKAKHEDDFPMDWHPHRGMDLLTYVIEGKGRHADSMGNRGTFTGPGMQWMRAGSGIFHAEGGANDVGEPYRGFQIWVNVPTENKMDEPKYGTHTDDTIPKLSPEPGVLVRVLAGPYGGTYGNVRGPFETIADVQIMDVQLGPNQVFTHEGVPTCMDNALVVCYKGSGTVNDTLLTTHSVAHCDASESSAPSLDDRQIQLRSGNEESGFMIFAGKRLNEPIAWYAAIVMSLDDDLKLARKELKDGTFLKVRADWDYEKLSAKPKSDTK